jgi:glycogen synthase
MPLKAALLTYSGTARDSRIRRMVRSLAEAGYAVNLVSPDIAPDMPGLAGHAFTPAIGETRAQVLRHLAMAAPSRLAAGAALPLHRLLPSCRQTLRALDAIRPDIIHANDWPTLPAAIAAARKTGARVIYDSHEFATEEHADRAWWRLVLQPHVRAVESRCIGAADHVLTVGPGIAGALDGLYGPSIRAMTVIRNLPDLPPNAPRREPDGSIRLAYAGLIRPERRIDAMIGALKLLDRRWRLRITGFGPESHLADLRRRAEALGVADRVTWHPPVAPQDMVAHLTESDIGLFLSDGAHGQQRFALPNKVFDYTGAGLAVAASGSADVAALLEHYGHGVMASSADAEALAAALRSMESAGIEGLKDKATLAARELNWSLESRKLLAVYAALAVKTPRQPQAA